MMSATLFPLDQTMPRAELRDAATTVRFMLAGNAYVTFQSEKTGTRFTYRVATAGQSTGRSNVSHFVSVLTSSDEYSYLGCIYASRNFGHGARSRIAKTAPSAVAFAWVWEKLTAGKMPVVLGVYHEGRCGKCGRRLTTPKSISSGLGPTCGGREDA